MIPAEILAATGILMPEPYTPKHLTPEEIEQYRKLALAGAEEALKSAEIEELNARLNYLRALAAREASLAAVDALFGPVEAPNP